MRNWVFVSTRGLFQSSFAHMKRVVVARLPPVDHAADLSAD
jgi:hypothetical protein